MNSADDSAYDSAMMFKIYNQYVKRNGDLDNWI